MNCSKCGKSLDVFDRYCSYCGTKVEGQRELVANSDINQKSLNYNKATIYGIASILSSVLALTIRLGIYFVIAGIIMGVFAIDRVNIDKRNNHPPNVIGMTLGFLGLILGVGAIVVSIINY